MRTVILAVICIILAGPSRAGFFPGNDLYPYCSAERTMALGFIAGVLDASKSDDQAVNDHLIESFGIIKDLNQSASNTIALANAQTRIKSYCEPNGITLGQASDILCQFLAAKPAMRHLPAASLLKQSLAEARPCQMEK